MSWLEVSLIVDGELAEAVAEVFARFAPDGVAIESTEVTARVDDSEGHSIGPLRVAAYLLEEAGLEERRQMLEEALWYLSRIQPLPPAQFRIIKNTDWSEEWKKHYQPITIGRKLIIVPEWLPSPEPGRIDIRIDPGMAFGTGTHPTTQLCLEILEKIQTNDSTMGTEVIDLGCGSGILAIAALKLGARAALGVDIDPLAVEAARQNAELNGVGDHLELRLGSLADIRHGSVGMRRVGMVLANILAPVLVCLLDEGLGELALPGGHLVLSGILEEQAGDVQAALERNNLALIDQRQKGDWVALVALRA